MLTDLTLGTTLILLTLSALSLSAWAVILKKALLFRDPEEVPGDLDPAIEHAARLEDVDALGGQILSVAHRSLLERARTFRDELMEPVSGGGSRLPGAGLRATDMQALQLSMEREIGEERSLLQAGVDRLSLVAATAPLIGLLGTVMGVMNTFTGIQASGAADIAAVAPGVSQALLTTVAGLIVAIPAAMAHQAFTSRIDDAEDRLHWFGAELVGIVAREMRQ